MDDEMREVVDEFLVESHENLDQMDRDFVTLERTPGDLEVLASVFRTIHTIKGTAGFLAFGKLEALTHVGESLLSRLRDGDLQLTDEITSGLLALVDAVRVMLSVIEATGEDGDNDHAELIARLTALNTSTAAPTATASEAETVVVVETVPEAVEPAPEQQRVGEIFVEQHVATSERGRVRAAPAGRRRPAARRRDPGREGRGPAAPDPRGARRATGTARAQGSVDGARVERRRQLDSSRRLVARQADEPGRRAGAGPQPDHPAHRELRRHRRWSPPPSTSTSSRPSCRKGS